MRVGRGKGLEAGAWLLSRVSVACAVTLTVCGWVAWTSREGTASRFGLLALGCLVTAAVAGRSGPDWRSVRPGDLLTAAILAACGGIAISTCVYVVVGFDGGLVGAFFESVAGVTTTATSVASDPEALGRGVLLWRAATQWLGGLGYLLLVVLVIPFLGLGDAPRRKVGAVAAGLIPGSKRARRLALTYGAAYSVLTLAGAVVFRIVGMGTFDAITYAATTISSGGFGNHAGSFGHFRDPAIEWAGAGGMLLAGMSMPLLVATFRGERSLLRSVELRAYLGIVVVSTLLVAGWRSTGNFDVDTVRSSAVAVTSMVSTTGHYAQSWGGWPESAQLVLLLLAGLGSMAGSVGGGFRIRRAMVVTRLVSRDVRKAIHPRRVVSVSVGEDVIGEELGSRIAGFQAMLLVVTSMTAFALAVAGADLLTSVSGAVSAVSTTGVGLGDLAPGRGGVGSLSWPGLLAIAAAAFVGRLEMYPVFGALVSAWVAVGRLARGVVARALAGLG
ncbi:MAG: Trk system potassium uptake protein [Acidimicrobiales bacterium]|nr:MAG: Trk system potassium uptake protein [Acidimicrobiales bacterium]